MQRVALARALACRPRALLLDEPLAALDVSVRRDMRRFLADRLRALAIPTVLVTHDLADAEALDGDIVVIEAGAIAQRGRLDRSRRAAPRRSSCASSSPAARSDRLRRRTLGSIATVITATVRPRPA